MSTKKFIEAYKNSDINELRKYIKLDPVLSIHNFMTRVEKSFTTNRDVYDVLVLILCNKYDLSEIVIDIINRDNTDLLESVLSYANDEIEENLIVHTLPKGRITMAKLIYEYIHKKTDLENNFESESESDSDSDSVFDSEAESDFILKNGLFVADLLIDYEFIYNKNEKSIDSFVIALSDERYEDAIKIMPFIDPSFWNNYAIKCAVSVDNLQIVKKLLQYDSVDPGVDLNCPLAITLGSGSYEISNELLKHPLVKLDELDVEFIIYLIENNCVCSMEKILNANIPGVDFCLQIPELINLVISCHNDVTYLLINMKKITTTNKKIKRNLKYYKVDKPYVELPYELKLDPEQIIKRAIKHNDTELAKSIRSYPVSITSFDLMCYLITYRNTDEDDSEESVCDYIWENILQQYNPVHLLLASFVIDRNIIIHGAMKSLNRPEFINVDKIILKMVPKYHTTLYDKIIEIVKDNPKLDLKSVYEQNNTQRELNWEQIKDICSIDELKEFIENLIKDNMVNTPLPEDFDDMDDDQKYDELDIAFDNFVF